MENVLAAIYAQDVDGNAKATNMEPEDVIFGYADKADEGNEVLEAIYRKQYARGKVLLEQNDLCYSGRTRGFVGGKPAPGAVIVGAGYIAGQMCYRWAWLEPKAGSSTERG